MYKNQLQELAQRSCFNLPSYACIREGPDHAPRFKASVNFNGELFEAPIYCTTLRQAEHAAAEVALNILSTRGPSRSLTARILDETGVYKNLLQETTHKEGLNLPVYTTVRSGFSHLPIFISTVELAGMSFTGEPAKTKKQSEKNAALSAWSALKRMSNRGIQPPNNKDTGSNEDQEQVVVARFLSNFRSKNDEKPRNPNDRYERRIENACRENYRASNNKLHYYLQRHLDMLSDVSVDHPIQNQMKPGGSVKFPHISSRVLPPVTILQGLTASKESSPLKSSLDSSRISDPVQRRTRLQTKLQEVPLPTEEHKLEEWPREVSIQTGKLNREDSNSSNPNIFCINPVSTAGVIGVSTRGRFNSVYHVPPLTTSTRTCQKHVFSFAPAVHIRSVIPVCAAPPAPTKPLINASSKEKRENSDLDSYSTKIPHTEEVPASSPNYRNLELSTSKNTHFRELDKIIF